VRKNDATPTEIQPATGVLWPRRNPQTNTRKVHASLSNGFFDGLSLAAFGLSLSALRMNMDAFFVWHKIL
jgi:hypothetical protein